MMRWGHCNNWALFPHQDRLDKLIKKHPEWLSKRWLHQTLAQPFRMFLVSPKANQNVYVCRYHVNTLVLRTYMRRTTNPQGQGIQTPTATTTAGGENRRDAQKRHRIEAIFWIVGF